MINRKILKNWKKANSKNMKKNKNMNYIIKIIYIY